MEARLPADGASVSGPMRALRRHVNWRRHVEGYVFIAPWLAGFLVLVAGLIYRHAFQFFRMGYAAALAWSLFAIVLLFTIVQFRVANRWVYYGGSPE